MFVTGVLISLLFYGSIHVVSNKLDWNGRCTSGLEKLNFMFFICELQCQVSQFVFQHFILLL